MHSRQTLLLSCLVLLLGGLPHLISTTTTTTLVAAMSIANQDLDRYFRVANATHTFTSMGEERITVDVYNYAFLNWSYVDPIDNQLYEVDYKEEKARYGEGRIMSVIGRLVHISNVDDVNDDFACTPYIRGTLGAPTPGKGVQWIALVRRGRCTFEDKVKNVFQQNAIGVIIYNDKQVMQLEKMQIKNKIRNIAAVITYQNIGLQLASAVDKGHNVTIAIIEGRNGVRPISNLNRTSVLFVSISFIVLMIISLVWLIFYYIQRFRYMQAKDQQSRNLCSVTKKAIMKIPTKTGKMTDEKDLDSDCCAICIEAYKPTDIIRILPCKHEFHKICIDPWLIEHRTCPMCKLDVLKFYGYVFLGSEESILEYEPDRTNETVALATSTTGQVGNPTRTGALADLMRSRDFVIDFPLRFVMEVGSVQAARDALFPADLPERSQSSLSLRQARDWMSLMGNRLEEQPHLRRLRKDEMNQQLLSIRDSARQRRSRSADGRYTNGCFARQRQQQQQQQPILQQQHKRRRSSCSSALQQLADASYAQSRQRQRDFTRMHRRFIQLDRDEISLNTLLRSTLGTPAYSHNERVVNSQAAPQDIDDVTAPRDANIIIQLNGEGVQLND